MDAETFRSAVLRNPVHDLLLDELNRIGVPDAWVVAGCLTQTVWNGLSGRVAGYGINDYDVFYFDPDFSWDAEDRVIAALRPFAERLGIQLEVRNQARVHLWYPQKHGVPYPPLGRARDGIDRFLTRCTQVGIQRTIDADVVYAPHGFDDIEAMSVRPNKTVNFSAAAYEAKAARWAALWPELTILPAIR